MSAQTIQDVFAPVHALYKAQVFEATWGHLAPKRNRTYTGHVVFAVGCYGDDELNPTILDAAFAGLDDSPWFFDAITEFIQTQRGAAGNVYRFDGTFRNYEFAGDVRLVFSSAGVLR